MNTRRAITIAALLAATGPVRAQVQNTQIERFDRQLEGIRRDTRLSINPDIPVGERTYFDYGGYVAFSYLSLDSPSSPVTTTTTNPDGSTTSNTTPAGIHNTGMRQYEVGFYTDLIFDGANEVFFRGHLFHRDFNPGDRFNSDGEGLDGRIDRLFYRFDLSKFQQAYHGVDPKYDVSIKIGRDLVLWGNGLTLSTDMDGGVVDLSYDPFTLEVIAGVTPLDTVDFDSARPRFDSRTERGLYGALGSMRVGTHRPYGYVLIQRDYNDDQLTAEDTIDGSPAIPTQFNYNSYYLSLGSSGALTDRLSYGVEGVYEGGHTLSSPFVLDSNGNSVTVTQTEDRISAWAVDGRLDYVLPDPHLTRLSGEILYASGDRDRVSSTSTTYGGNKPGTVDRAFNAFGLPDIGTAFAPAVSNLLMFRIGATSFPLNEIKPLRKMQLGTDLYFFAKANPAAPIDEATTNDRWLGLEPDIFMNWQMTSDVSLTVRYGLFVPGDAIVDDAKMRQFLFAGVTVSF
jgi:hypothetical protein